MIRRSESTMNRMLRPLTLGAIALAAIACGPATASGAPSGSPTGSPARPFSPAATATATASARPTASDPSIASPAASPTIDEEGVLTPSGIGPYQVGAASSDLAAAGLIANVMPSTNCDSSWQWAEATIDYGGLVAVGFHDGRMTQVSTDSPGVETASGGRVGLSREELLAIHGGQATRIEGQAGNVAYSVRAAGSGLGIVFYLDATNASVQAMAAGDADLLEQAAVVGEGC